jgi:uncharacterized membrane protein/protein-disulfide isomerase
MSTRTRWLILAFAVAGLGLAGSSSWVHYKSLTDPSYVSPCDINASFNCTQLYLGAYGSVAGVPVALGGVIWFGLVALVAAFAQPNRTDGIASGYLRALSVVGLAVVLYLAYVSFFVVKSGCLLCMGTYVCVIGIFALSMFTNGESMARLPGRLGRDVAVLLKRPVALVAAIVYLLGAASLVAFFPKEGALAERAAAAPAPAAAAQATFEEQWAKQPRVDFGIPAEGAKVIIVKFNDYECGACAQAEMIYKPIVQKYAKSHPGLVRYILKDWPWNTKCNFNAGNTIPGHEAACDAAVAARIAREKGKYDEMATWLYANQGVSSEAVRAEVRKRFGITDFDREYALKLPGIRSDVADGGVLGISATPTYFLNGVRLPNGMRPEYIELAINIELKRP